MEVDQRTEEIIKNTIAAWRPQVQVLHIKAIPGDASPRRYYHIALDSSSRVDETRVVAMIFDSLVSPDSGKTSAVKANEAVLRLTKYLIQNDYPVPKLYWGTENDLIFLVEDLGDEILAKLIIGQETNRGSQQNLFSRYREASQLILKLQKMPKVEGFFPFERSFSKTIYLKELSEFQDFVFSKYTVDKTAVQLLHSLFKTIAEELDQVPQVLIHRDFHSWNLIIDKHGQLRVIDFQDALMGSRCYDIAALLNDRDTDRYLGPDLYKRLLKAYWQDIGHKDDFLWEYYRVLLQRDLRVAGRFNKLSVVRGLSNYERWVPGTIHRIGWTLKGIGELGNADSIYEEATKILLRFISEIKEGYRNNKFLIK